MNSQPANATEAEQDDWKTTRVLGVQKKWFVPILIEFCSLIMAMGAGMTVKFFPLFFKEDYGLKPIAFNGLSAGYTLAIAVFVQLCRKVSSKLGRCQAVLMWQSLGVFCLFALYKSQPLFLVILLYIIRGAFANALGPINSAIVLECVDPKLRGRWTALQSISRFSWSGSAVLGGWLADSHDYRYTFLITAFIYAASAVCYSPLLFIVPAQTSSARTITNTAATGTTAGTSMVNMANGSSDETSSKTADKDVSSASASKVADEATGA